MAITLLVIAMNLQKPFLLHLQHLRQQHQQLPHHLVMDMFSKSRNLVPVVLDQLRMLAPLDICVRKFGHVVDLRVVFERRTVGECAQSADPQRLVAIVTPVLQVGAVFDLFGLGEREEGRGESELRVDLGLCEPEVGYVEEAWKGGLGWVGG